MTRSIAHIEYPDRYFDAVKARIIANAQKTWRKNNPDHAEIEAFLTLGRSEENRRVVYENNFVGSLAKAFDTYGKLTENQCRAVLKSIAMREERIAKWKQAVEEQKARSEFMGVVSEKAEATLTVEKVITVEATKFSYYDRANQEVYLMRDEKGNRIVLKTKSWVLVPFDAEKDQNHTSWTETKKDGKEYRMMRNGDVIKAKSVIKAHSESRGEKQTIIQRLKIVALESFTEHRDISEDEE